VRGQQLTNFNYLNSSKPETEHYQMKRLWTVVLLMLSAAGIPAYADGPLMVPSTPGGTTATYLSELSLDNMVTGWGTPQRDAGANGGVLQITGVRAFRGRKISDRVPCMPLIDTSYAAGKRGCPDADVRRFWQLLTEDQRLVLRSCFRDVPGA
jgi:hypothetical protein